MRILVVEDSIDNQQLVARKLENVGASVMLANNGKEAILAVATTSCDVILMDLQMPEMDGFTAVAHLRSEGYTKPILALTAHAQVEEISRCMNRGFDDHISKPIDFPLLISKLFSFKEVAQSNAQSPIGQISPPNP